MHKFLLKITPEGALRIGLGVMYVYSGTDILRHPTAWYWAVRPLLKLLPTAMQPSFANLSFLNNFLRVQGFIELLFAFILLAWFLNKKYIRWVAGLTALEMMAILFFLPIDAVTFRDFGLLGAGLALFLLLRGGDENKSRLSTTPGRPVPEKKTEGELTVETFDQFMGQGK